MDQLAPKLFGVSLGLMILASALMALAGNWPGTVLLSAMSLGILVIDEKR